jgi:inhibitor of cysteine peptidase
MNKDNYKNAIDQIHASDELKEKTIRKMKQAKQNKISYIKILSSVAVILIIFSIGIFEFENYNSEDFNTEDIAITIKNDLPRFKDMKELKEALHENENYYRNATMKADATLGVNDLAQEESIKESKFNNETLSDKENVDYSKTNVQVDNVDEADIVKTDGDYIYYVAGNKVFIVDSKELKVISTIKIKEDKKEFNPKEIFINNNKLIVLGNFYEYEEEVNRKISNTDYEEDMIISSDIARITSTNVAKAIVYDISNKETPKIIREVGLDGNYMNSRMIGDNVFIISRKAVYYYDGIEEEELLPRVQDSIIEQKTRSIDCTDIAYFRGTDDKNYMLIGGFNINNNEEISVETFFGASEDVYASENNLYLSQTVYDDNWNTNTTIYKFTLTGSQIVLQAKGEVEGYLNNQFSMDEYEGNLRLATTYTIKEESEEVVGDAKRIPEIKYSNRLYVLDKDLKEIGRIDDLAKDEKIYSVRFIGKIGYIVTFEQIDPLFVIDLSDPTNPEIKGELKIPGYSSYLHPYDENHIIGIGYNTKSNEHGGITNDNMKMSMFDVSDVENPKEMFSIDIGTKYVYSEILYNHKSLFYKKSENLIGFSVNYDNKNRFEIFKIDLENGFEKYGEILNDKGFRGIERAIYIEDILYTLHYNRIISYNLNTFEKLNELELISENNNDDLIIAY